MKQFVKHCLQVRRGVSSAQVELVGLMNEPPSCSSEQDNNGIRTGEQESFVSVSNSSYGATKQKQEHSDEECNESETKHLLARRDTTHIKHGL